MSTELLLDCEHITYRELVADLPEGLRIRWSFDPAVSGYDDGNTTLNDYGRPRRRRLWLESIPHVLLEDDCKNTLWLGEATQHWLTHKIADFVGEAAFEHFGLQGSLVHFGHAFRAARWGDLYDPVTTWTWADPYLERTGDDQAGNQCRACVRRRIKCPST